jgi:hypothetical protein
MLRIIMYPLCNSREVDGKVGVESEVPLLEALFSMPSTKFQPGPGLAQFTVYWLQKEETKMTSSSSDQ